MCRVGFGNKVSHVHRFNSSLEDHAESYLSLVVVGHTELVVLAIDGFESEVKLLIVVLNVLVSMRSLLTSVARSFYSELIILRTRFVDSESIFA